MDDLARQNEAEERYKELRGQTRFEKYEGNFKSPHYHEVPNNALKQTIIIKPKEYMTDYQTKFNEAAKDFWKEVDPKSLAKYQMGETVCSFNTNDLSLNAYLDRIFHMIRASITIELAQSNKTTEELKTAFDMLDLSMKNLADLVLKSKKDIDIQAMVSFMHGFINTYVNKNIKGR